MKSHLTRNIFAGFLGLAYVTSLHAADRAVLASNTFGERLFNELSQGSPAGNIIFSPFSISTALAMLAGGASGKTAAQFYQTFGVRSSPVEFQTGFGKLSKQLSVPGFESANRIWVDQRFSILPGYGQFTRKHYGAEAEKLNFQKEAEASRLAINNWVEDRTRNRIKDLFKPGDITPTTRLVLANAVYFKALWEKAFKQQKTEKADFKMMNAKKSKTVLVPMMQQQSVFEYLETPKFQAIALPYKDGGLTALVLLPREASQKAMLALQKELRPAKLEELLNSRLSPTEVKVFLPRFTFSLTSDLNPLLAKMGIVDAFRPGKADFSKISGNKDLSVSKAVHKAFIEVNEEGTEAAAATGMSMGITSMPTEEAVVFRADHPFLFLVIDRNSGTVLFAARVMNPAEH
ncbi:MAG: hypothetical protein A2070_05415 [Bdellovibrionales bacterium GWC1_52_8]|nr:MAG: hypothetical protein A2Z97_03895 [Bdellovibrionales bacterium GWB1_52_6]OFZ04308.1 MAG: hypothetical protein A2X97_06580 [Bdellovibrionales bacterium GWA1_52_35]OFZ43710.1 MAG: hypothetical protein A2070_05415 [Bdellovibrionales bacterium GWC1_52_8]HCM40843.1 serpin family protein [Bdellovibrionales bacterium]